MAQIEPNRCAPACATLGTADILRQFRRDIFGKETHQAATYSYLWLADQMGHVGLGILLLFAVTWVFELLGWGKPPGNYAPLIIAASAVALWELKTYLAFAGRATGRFRLDRGLLARNAVVATLYMIFGAIAAFYWHAHALWAMGISCVLIAASIALARCWLKQKIIWQKAGLPFLARLAEFPATISEEDAKRLETLLDREIRRKFSRDGAGPVVIVTGPPQSGKTTLACSIGTECAFRGVKVRYLTFDKLAQSATSDHDDTGPENVAYWPWTESEVLLIDDIDDAGMKHRGQQPYLLSRDFSNIVAIDVGAYQPCLSRRLTVWMLGQRTEDDLPNWVNAIVACCTPVDPVTGLPCPEPEHLVIRLSPTIASAPRLTADSDRTSTERMSMISRRWMVRALQPLGWSVIIASSAALLLSFAWLVGESRWDSPADNTPEQAFVHGTLGLEFAPYKLVAVLDRLAGDATARGTKDDPVYDGSGPWWRRYGFAEKGGPATPSAQCPVPLGFTISNLLPGSAAPSPVAFVGLSCAACHSQRIRTADYRVDSVVVGAGSASADVIALTDALKNAVAKLGTLDDAAAKIQAEYAMACGEDRDGFVQRWIERIFIGRWIRAFNDQTLLDASKIDMPHSGGALLTPNAIAAGPSRTRPFRSVVRVNLDFPGSDNFAFSKVPAAFEQTPALRPRSQYDGSIVDPVTRSLVAAYTSNSSIAALARPAITHNIRAAASYTMNLGPATGVPTYGAMFNGVVPPPDKDQLDRGRAAYVAHCQSCHGHRPANGGWWETNGAARLHRTTPMDELGTDRERLVFRYASLLPDSLWLAFPGSPVPRASRGNSANCGHEPTPAGYIAVEAQRDAIRSQAERAVSRGEFAFAGYWRGARAERFEADRRTYPAGHPLAFDRDTLCYDESNLGYFNNPIPLTYLRAPYLHNGSVPTIAQLINLDERPSQFCRGDNAYDPLVLGLSVSGPVNGKCESATPFLFDTALRGNSNKGHDYPWPRAEVEGDPARQQTLRDLLVYLRTQ